MTTHSSRRPHGRLRCYFLIAALMTARLSFGAMDTNDVSAISLPDWMRFYALRSGIGYKDNVLLSRDPRGSAFVSAGGDFMMVRLPGSGVDAQFFLSADRTHFLASDVPDSEHTIAGVGKVSFKSGRATTTLSANYVFQDQVLDASTTEPEFNTIRIRVHDMAVKPAVRYDLARPWFVEVEPAGRRQEFAKPLDDIWEVSLKATLGYEYGFRSRATLSAQASERFYDEKTQRTSAGESIPGTSLRMHRVIIESAVEHYWDEKRVWRTQGRLGYWRNNDNGSGYFDYDRWFAQVQMRYKRAPWELRAQVRFDDYIYAHQTVSATNSDRRRENEITVGCRAERQITNATKVFVQYDRVVSRSSRSLDEYNSQTVSGGAQWDF